MEFFLFLNRDTQELINQISKAKYTVMENNGICYHSFVTGFVKVPEKSFTICTDNIKKSFRDVELNINRVVTHESMHVAQMCNDNRPLGIPKSEISKENHDNILRSIEVGNNINYEIEYEAYLMENNPKEVIHYIRRYCF